MIALFPNSVSNTFLSGRVGPILGNFGFRLPTFELGPKKSIAYTKKRVSIFIFPLNFSMIIIATINLINYKSFSFVHLTNKYNYIVTTLPLIIVKIL